MRFNKYYGILTFSLLFSQKLYAANLIIDNASDVGSDGVADGVIAIQSSNQNPNYQGNYSGMKSDTPTGAGILSDTSNNGSAWIVSSDENITSSDNRVGVRVNANGKVLFEGNGSNKLNASDNIGDDGFGAGIGVYSGEMSVKNMDVIANKNANFGVYGEGGKIVLSGNGNNDLSANNNDVHGINVISGGEVNISGYNVSANNNITNGISSTGGSKINITGIEHQKNILTAEGNGSYGIWANNAGSEVNIKNMDLVLNNNRWGVYAGGSSIINIIGGEQRNTINAVGNISYALVSRGAGSILNVENMDIYASGGATVITAENGGEMNIKNSSIYSSKSAVFFSYASSGTYNLTNTFVDTDTDILLRATADVTNFNAVDSILNGSSILNSGGDLTFTFENTLWNMRNTSAATNLDMKDSKVDLRARDNSVFNTLTVKNLAMTGENTFYINTYFDGDGTSTDKLVVDGGNATGKGTLFVTSAGTDGEHSTKDGIMVVDLTNALDKFADFDLYGGVVDSGFYEYGLQQGGDENWYLKSNGRMSTVAKVMSNIPALHLSIVKTGMGELRKRMGELRDINPNTKDGAWVRSYAKHMNVDDAIDSSLNLYGIEGGYDHQIYGDCDSKVFAGVTLGYLYSDRIRFRSNAATRGDGDSNTLSAGLYTTWLNYNGWFADAILRSFWSKIDVNAYSSQEQKINTDPTRQFTTLDLEFGRQMLYDTSDTSSIILEPKVELSYAYGKGKEFKTSSKHYLYYGASQSFVTRGALAAIYQKELENGMILKPFIEFGLNQEWDGRTDVDYAGGHYKSDLYGFSYDVSLGLNAKLDEKWNMYSDITYETGSQLESVSANIGIRYSW